MDPGAIVLLLAWGAGIVTFGVYQSRPTWLAWYGAHAVKAWRTLANELGLFWHGKGDRLSGLIDGHFVAVTAGYRPPKCITVVSVALWPPLDLGLKLLQSAGGDGPKLERESPRARALLTPDLRAKLDQVSAGWVELNDEWVTIGSEHIEKPAALRERIRLASAIVDAIDGKRNELGVPPEIKRWAKLWQSIADKHRFAMTFAPLGMLGNERGFEVRVFARVDENLTFRVATRAQFKDPLGIGFRARSRSAIGHASPWSTERITLGDPEFDARFELDAFDRKLVEQPLEPATLRALTEISMTALSVLVDDYAVEVQTESPDEEDIEHVLSDVCRVAELVDFTHVKRQAAYR